MKTVCTLQPAHISIICHRDQSTHSSKTDANGVCAYTFQVNICVKVREHSKEANLMKVGCVQGSSRHPHI
jgi:hypothetical protein